MFCEFLLFRGDRPERASVIAGAEVINGTHRGDPPLLTTLPVSFKEAEEARSLSSTRDKWTARKRASAKRGKILADRNAMKTKRALLCQREREGERDDPDYQIGDKKLARQGMESMRGKKSWLYKWSSVRTDQFLVKRPAEKDLIVRK